MEKYFGPNTPRCSVQQKSSTLMELCMGLMLKCIQKEMLVQFLQKYYKQWRANSVTHYKTVESIHLSNTGFIYLITESRLLLLYFLLPSPSPGTRIPGGSHVTLNHFARWKLLLKYFQKHLFKTPCFLPRDKCTLVPMVLTCHLDGFILICLAGELY